MRVVAVLAASLVMLGVSFALAVPVDASHGSTGHFPTSDYCGWVYRHPMPNGFRHNGLDIWTNANCSGLSGAKGFPVQLVAEGVFKEYKYGNSKLYGIRFYHPAPVNKSSHYWHMAPADGQTSTTYVEQSLVVGMTYPAGTFLGYQGNYTPGSSDTTTHLHVTITPGDSQDNGYVPGEGGIGEDPTGFFGRQLNYDQSGGQCYFPPSLPSDNSIHYQGPLPETAHPYTNNFTRWYVIVNWQPTATAVKAEFCTLRTEATFDRVQTHSYALTLYDNLSGFLTPPNRLSSLVNGRTMLILFTADGSITYDGFAICNYHSS